MFRGALTIRSGTAYSSTMDRSFQIVLVVAMLLAAVVLRLERKPSMPAPAPPVRVSSIEDPSTYWTKHGFVPMIAPIRPPTSDDLETRIVVMIKLPDGARITTRSFGNRYVLEYPPGTIADRIEYIARGGGLDDLPSSNWFVADVRGMMLGPRGQELYVYRPTAKTATSPLAGIAWPRDDEAAQKEATRALGTLVEERIIVGPASAAERSASAAHLRGLNDCAGCHVPYRAPRGRAEAPGIVNRGTDGTGFFHASTILEDRAPLETYRSRNANAGDPFVRFVCGTSEVPTVPEPGLRGIVRCPDGEIPVGILDVASAIHARDPHGLRVCASRRYLVDHLDETGRRVFGGAMAACGEALFEDGP